MKRREFLASGSAAALMVSSGTRAAWAAPAPAVSAADASLYATMDHNFYAALPLRPQRATQLGLDSGPRAALKSMFDDTSAAGLQRRFAEFRRALGSLRALPDAGLSATAQRQRALAIYLAEQDLAPQTFGLESAQQPYPISQQQGAYFGVPDFLDSGHAVTDAHDAEAYLARLSGFARALDDQAGVQNDLATRGLIAPGWALDLAIGQIERLRAPAPEANALTLSLATRTAKQNIAGDWSTRAAKIVAGSVNPALDRHLAMLHAMRAQTAPGDGIWRVKQGDAIYALALATATTTAMTPAAVHQTGLDHVAELSARLDMLLKASGYTKGTVGERLAALGNAADQLYPNTDAGRADLIADLNIGIEAMKAHLPAAFNDVPDDPLEIRRVPPNIQDGAPNGYYYPASLDGSRPAIYWINLKNTSDWPRYQLPDLTYHEGIPGHHLQGSIVRHQAALPILLRDVFISSYGEGWALYAEQLAYEMGVMPGLLEAGFLQSLLFRSTRLVVDTGIHHLRWSRERATDYLVATTGMPRPRSQREIERYCTLIGQACSYKIGHDMWLRLRGRAQTALGAKFSLPWFHDILKESVMPLSMLETRVDQRIAAALQT